MQRRTQPGWLLGRRVLGVLLLALLLNSGATSHASLRAAVQPQAAGPGGGSGIADSARQQIAALLAEKAARTPAQQKIDSNLLYAARQARGLAVANGVPALQTDVAADATGLVEVDIITAVNKGLIAQLNALGAQIHYANARYRSVRARVPLRQLEAIASLNDISFIQPQQKEETDYEASALLAGPALQAVAPALVAVNTGLQRGLRPDFATRAAHVRAQVNEALARGGAGSPAGPQAPQRAPVNTSEGDVTHRANLARSSYGVDGTGIKVGVLSDGVNSLAALIASGDLPANVTVLPGQAGSGNEGAAMLEIVHDLAPGAKLYFATAFKGGITSFAQNIHDLRAAGCDIIIDDVFYFVETPFQQGQALSVASSTNAGVVIQAVLDVTADGALYFSAAGNEGNLNDSRSGAWEGDFADGGVAAAPVTTAGTLHDFDPGAGVSTYDTITAGSNNPVLLHWADPLGGSNNDYDLFVLNAAGTDVVGSSTNIQNGAQDPIEGVGNGANATHNRVVVVKKTTAANRFMHINTFRGRLAFGTAGQTHGHSAVDSTGAYGVAASPVGAPFYAGFPNGPYPSPFNASNVVEGFSSDGPRRYFFTANGAPVTPGNFSSTGGTLIQKPDLAAADGVSCAAPGFNPFYGTSAAAPHAGAIAALVKSANSSLTAAQVRTILANASIDIEAAGVDRDSGTGILDALSAVQGTGISPQANLKLGTWSATPIGGDGDGNIEPGETASLSAQLANLSAIDATAITTTLTTNTSRVTIINDVSVYPNIGGNSSALNVTPFSFALASSAPCGLKIDFTLSVSYTGASSPKVFTFSVQTGQPNAAASTVSFNEFAVAIPDGTGPDQPDAPAVVRIPVSGLSAVSDINFRIDGTTCSTDKGATTVGIDHTYVGDLVFTLTSPSGTTVTLISRLDDGYNTGHNFCQTVLDDEATDSIQSVTAADAPFTGSFKPYQALSAFDGEAANGIWTLRVTDFFSGDVGNVRAVSLVISSFACDASVPSSSTPTSTATATLTSSPTPSNTATGTSTATDISTATDTSTATSTASNSPTLTPTLTSTPTNSPTRAASPLPVKKIFLPGVYR